MTLATFSRHQWSSADYERMVAAGFSICSAAFAARDRLFRVSSLRPSFPT